MGSVFPLFMFNMAGRQVQTFLGSKLARPHMGGRINYFRRRDSSGETH